VSLAIDTARVEAILLADKWHIVKNHSLRIDAYEFVDGGGAVRGLPSAGASWTEPDGTVVACPLAAVVAVKMSGGSGERPRRKTRGV
jgi:hypothetical protein